ncbi:efflux RND transporter permease subunit [Bacillus sp. JCM 19034]|uniref:efflux RND transporter permease subunit n=1 Tax=Bacillus sp. JCM 19034 TaxID=1481928 RepID=UPI00078358E6|nr:efflux RND transporter permease subunit [Bacillus sp. JCM 19034]
MGAYRYLIQRKILIGLAVLFIIMAGCYSMVKLDKELFPAITLGGAFVDVNAGELAATEVERQIIEPIEREVMAIEGVETVVSSSSIGRGSIDIIFERDSKDTLYQDIQAAIHAVTADTRSIQHIEIGQYGTNQDYEFFMDLSEGEMAIMSEFATDVLKPRLEQLREVRDVALMGLEEYEVVIEFKREQLEKNNIPLHTLIGLIQQENSEATLGVLTGETDAPTVRWDQTFQNIEELRELPIPSEDDELSLEDLASVSLERKKTSTNVWKNGTTDFIFIQIGRVDSVSQIDMASAIRDELQSIQDEGLVQGFEINELVAQADYVQSSLDEVSTNIIIGAAIAIVILLLFLRNVRATLIIAVSIPTSALLTFLSMWVFGYSFNILTLIGLGLGIGMMVDASIVILESIYRKMEQGLGRLQAVLQGTKEVATAVIASVLTTIVVFIPIGLIGGEIGQFMIFLSVVVAIALISSVVVSFTVIPSIAETFLKLSKKKKLQSEGKGLKVYSSIVSFVVKRKINSLLVILGFCAMFVGSFFFVTKIPMAIMPDVFNRYTEMGVEIEPGLTVQEKEELFTEIHQSMSAITDVESNYIMDNGTIIYLMINMTKDDDITREQADINEEISSVLRDLQEEQPIRNSLDMLGGGGGTPVHVNLTGEDVDELVTLSDQFAAELEKVDGIVGVTHSAERSSLEEVIVLNNAEIEEAGISSATIQQMIQESFLEMPISEMNHESETVEIVAQWEEPVDQKHQLLDLTIPTLEGEKKLGDFIQFVSKQSLNEIRRIDGERFISITANMEGRDLGSVNRDVQQVVNEFSLPSGYQLSLAGDLEEQQELMEEMLLVLGMAIFLVYVVMAVQFNSFIHPLIVMSVIPMTIVGAILGLLLTQQELNILSGVGVIMLIGIVLNNAILLIDRTNKLRLDGMSVETAIVEAGKNRIRPIFMTTLTTSGGMLPLALSSGDAGQYQAPMAIVIISGLLFATLITLVLIPAVYRLFSFGKYRSVKKKKELTV